MKIAKTKVYSYVAPLVKRGCTASVVDFPFRHIQEVAAYVGSIQAEIASSIQKASNVEDLRGLYARLSTVQTVDRVLEVSFKRDCRVIAPSVQKLKSALTSKIRVLEQAENKRALEKETRQYRVMRQCVAKELSGLSSEICEISYVLGDKAVGTRWQIVGATTLGGFVYPEFFFELSFDSVPRCNTKYSAAVPTLKGVETSSEKLKQTVHELLCADNLRNEK